MELTGETKRGIEIGHKDHNRLFVWHACINCGKERWVQMTGIRTGKGRPMDLRCRSCGKKKEGKRRRNSGGYIVRSLSTNDCFVRMATKYRTVLEHRLVMAQYLNRCLLPSEIVHHLNGIKDDNRIENLCVVNKSEHRLKWREAFEDGYKTGINIRDKELEKQIKLLQWQVQELQKSLNLKLEI